ncbi:uncharacterized protein [Lepidochelys kempii]|uniref:uncharacterized protein isoform X6 n=1 Tax=Lepidochelys kempii TaxID=8472 RepID=UPI003C705AFB
MWGAELAGEAGAGRARPGQEPPLPAPPPPRAREPFEPPRERRAPLGKEREAAEAEEQRQSQELLGAGSSGGREDGAFRKPEPGFAELERRLSDFSLTSAVLQQVLRGFKGCRMTSPGPSRFSQPARGWEMGMAELAQGPVTFEEVAVYFTREDWWTPLREPSPETSCRRPTRT